MTQSRFSFYTDWLNEWRSESTFRFPQLFIRLASIFFIVVIFLLYLGFFFSSFSFCRHHQTPLHLQPVPALLEGTKRSAVVLLHIRKNNQQEEYQRKRESVRESREECIRRVMMASIVSQAILFSLRGNSRVYCLLISMEIFCLFFMYLKEDVDVTPVQESALIPLSLPHPKIEKVSNRVTMFL